jgi:hypothetical protein
LVILREKDSQLKLNYNFIGAAQIILFSAGSLSLLASVLAEELFSANANQLPRTKSRETLLRHATLRLRSVIETLDYVEYALERLSTLPHCAANDDLQERRCRVWHQLLEESSNEAHGLAARITTNLDRAARADQEEATLIFVSGAGSLL